MQDKIHSSYKQLEQKSKYTNMFLRWFLYFVLVVFALYFIFPLYVMVVTSIKNNGRNPSRNTSNLAKWIKF